MERKLRKNVTSRTGNSINNMITGIGGQILSILLRFVTRTVFIKTLGKEYLGISGLFSDIFMMLSLTELGLDTAIIYRMYKPIANKDDKRVRILLKFYKNAYIVIGCAILLIGACLIPVLPFLIKDYDKLYELHINAVLVFVLYLMQSVTSYFFFAYRSSVVIASQKKYLLDITNYVITVFDYIVRLVVLVLWKNFVIYITVAVISSAIKNVVRAVVAQHRFPQFFIQEEGKLERTEIKEMFKDCGALFVNKANTVILKATDNLVLSKFVGLAIVGVYSNYLMIYTTLHNLLEQINKALSASIGNLFATEDIERTYDFFRVTNFTTFIMYGTGCVGIAVCADELINTWISKDFVISQPFSVLVGLELLLAGISNNLSQIRSASGVFQKFWYSPLIGIITNILVSIVMVSVYGIYGVIIGTLVSRITTSIIFEPYIIHKYTFCNYKPVSEYYKQCFLYLSLLIAVYVVDYYICSSLLVGYGWLSVVFHAIIIGISVPAIFLLVFINTEECKYLVRTIMRLIHNAESVNKR